MNQDVTDYINNLNDKPKQAWQVDVCHQLRKIVHEAVPDIEERIQYGKPHFLKKGKYAFVLGTAKGWVTFTIFNAAALSAPDGFFETGDSDRKTIKVLEGQAVDFELLAKLVQQAANV